MIRQMASAAEDYDMRDADLELACRNVDRLGLDAILVASRDVADVKRCLTGNAIVVGLISYPSGALPPGSKRMEAEGALADGSDALCLVADCGAYRDGRKDVLAAELAMLAELCAERPRFLCIESVLMSDDQIEDIIAMAVEAGIAGLVISTGFEGYGIERDGAVERQRTSRLAAGRLPIADFTGLSRQEVDIAIVPRTLLGADQPLLH